MARKFNYRRVSRPAKVSGRKQVDQKIKRIEKVKIKK